VVVTSPIRLLLLTVAAFSPLSAQERVIVDSVADLQACVDRPAGTPLVCALRSSPTPYAISGATLTIRRSDTTIEGAAEPGQDPPTLRRMDPELKKMILVHKFASNVTIRNLQIDGNTTLVPGNGIQDLSVEGSSVTVADNYFGDSASLSMFFNGPHFTLRHNTFGKLMVGGTVRPAPGMRPGRTAILGWGPKATQFVIESNNISDYNGAICINDVPAGTDPSQAGVIANNTLYHNATCVPNCGGGQIYVSGKTTNVKITNNTINGGWAESSQNRDQLHSYGIEMDKASYIYTSSNQIFNNSISGMWIGSGANHITIENDAVYNNGLNGVQISGGRQAAVSDISILGLTSQHNDQHRGSGAPYPTLPRFFGVMIQDGGASRDVCIQTDSNLATNAKGPVYAEGRYFRGAACPRPYN
jgi:Right handed beta helix region